jgi:hypothetical protein
MTVDALRSINSTIFVTLAPAGVWLLIVQMVRYGLKCLHFGRKLVWQFYAYRDKKGANLTFTLVSR